jgi:hypothetical protein
MRLAGTQRLGNDDLKGEERKRKDRVEVAPRGTGNRFLTIIIVEFKSFFFKEGDRY